ncbi:MAG: tetratricopeptide repeat protein [Chloroflexota bacterium]
MLTAEQENDINVAGIAVKNNPNNFEAYVELGMAYFEANQFDDAMAAFQQAIQLNPDAAAAHNGVGRVCYHTGPVQAAIDAYERAIELDRKYKDPYYGLGILYFSKLGDYDAAIEAFQRAIELHPGDSSFIVFLGITYSRMGQFDAAINTFQRAIDLDPESTFAYGNLSIVYLYQSRFAEMIATCKREIEIEDAHDARRMLGYVYELTGQPEQAIEQLEQSIALAPTDYEARGALAKMYHITGRTQDASEHYAMASAMAGRDDEYGQACFESVSGNSEQALKLLETALTKGQLQSGWARIDPEFVFVRDDPRFKSLVEN